MPLFFFCFNLEIIVFDLIYILGSLRSERVFDIRSNVQRSSSSEENLSKIMESTDSNNGVKSTDPSADVYQESSCVPCTIKQDDEHSRKTIYYSFTFFFFIRFSILDISFVQQNSTIITIEASGPKKNKNSIGHIMISYNHSTKKICTKIAKKLKVIQKQ